jgi:hypothetical protein
MENIKRLVVFDFDETLFRMPGYTDRFSVERLYPELEFKDPYSFYDHPKSMCPEIHNIQLIGPVYDDWKKATVDPSTRVILITHRTEELRPCAELLLEKHGIVFDTSYFLGRLCEKISILKKEIDLLPNVKEISIYEDSLEQLRKYQDFFYEYTAKIKPPVRTLDDLILLDMHFVDKSKVIQLFDFSAGESKRINLI